MTDHSVKDVTISDQQGLMEATGAKQERRYTYNVTLWRFSVINAKVEETTIHSVLFLLFSLLFLSYESL
jgi:hypothetical protein